MEMIGYEHIERVNKEMAITKLKNEKTGKEIGDYVEVNERIKAFRKLFPTGTIKTEMLSNENGVCIFKASVGYQKSLLNFASDGNGEQVNTTFTLLGTGTAQEKEGSTFINRTSYIENCETSAVGRALAMCGFGIDKSVASAEEVENAINNQEITEDDAKNYVFTFGKYKGKSISGVYQEDKEYLNWCLDKYNDENLKQMIEMITDLKRTPIPETEEAQRERLELINELGTMIAITQYDLDKVLDYYKVSSTSELTNEQLEEAINKLNKIGE